MGVKLVSSSGGSVELNAPTTASNYTLTVPANNGTVITTASTFAGTGPAFSAYQSSTQNISTGTATKLTFTSSVFDTTGGMYASSTFTPTIAGYYQVNASVGWATGVTNTNQILHVYKNGASYYAAYNGSNTASGAGAVLSTLVYCNGSTDYIEIYALQQSGGTLSTFLGTKSTAFSAALVRAA